MAFRIGDCALIVAAGRLRRSAVGRLCELQSCKKLQKTPPNGLKSLSRVQIARPLNPPASAPLLTPG